MMPEDRYGLPGWTYFNSDLFELESEKLFRQYWQLVCHQSDVAKIGQFITFDLG
jgi:phenylpropionate dioxygenase-like ring-hydroxylating dioxygenase large terminal subunit